MESTQMSDPFDLEISMFTGNPMVISEHYFTSLSDKGIKQMLKSGRKRRSDLTRAVTHIQQIENLESLLPTGSARFLSSLRTQIQSSKFEETIFENFYEKRLSVLTSLLNINGKFMQYVAKCRKHSTNQRQSNPTRTVTDAPKIHPILRWGLLSMFPLIDSISTTDPRLKQRVLKILIQVLKTSPPLSLAEEPEETWDEMVSLLMSPSSPDSSEVISALLGLALQRGSLRHILAALKSVAQRLDEPLMLDVEPYLESLESYGDGIKILSVIYEDAQLGAWAHQLPFIVSMRTSESEEAARYGSSAGCAAYVYVHSCHGLMKIGTGSEGTIRGQLYAFNPAARPNEEGWLVRVNGELYFRSTRMEGLAVRFDCDTLKEMYTIEAKTPQGMTSKYCQMTSEGQFLYLLRYSSDERKEFTIDVYAINGRTAHRTRSIPLPTGWTQFPTTRRDEKSEEERRSPYHFYVGQKVDAKDSVNKWCPASVVQVTPCRVLLHYDGWSSKWDEWFEIDSERLDSYGKHTHGSQQNTSKQADVQWSFLEMEEVQTQDGFSPDSKQGSKSPNDGKWTHYPARVTSRIEEVFRNGDQQPFTIRVGQKEYMIDLSRMEQEDPVTGVRVRIRRSDPHMTNAFAFLEDIHFFCTGCQLVAIIPPQIPPNMGNKTIQRAFSLENGAWLGDETLDLEWVSSAYYDPEKNLIWSYRATTSTLQRSTNKGPIHDTVRTGLPISQTHTKNTNQPKPPSSPNPKPSLEIPSLTVLNRVFKQLSLYARVSHSGHNPSSRQTLRRPYCIDVHMDTFEYLDTIIQQCCGFVSGEVKEEKGRCVAEVEEKRKGVLATLSYVLELLETNLVCLQGNFMASIQPVLTRLRTSLESLKDLSTERAAKQNSGGTHYNWISSRVNRCLMAGCQYFYPSAEEVRDLILKHLESDLYEASCYRDRTKCQEHLLDSLAENPQLLLLLSSPKIFATTAKCLVKNIVKATTSTLLKPLDPSAEANPLDSENSGAAKKSSGKAGCCKSEDQNRLQLLSPALRLLTKLQLYYLTLVGSFKISDFFHEYTVEMCTACTSVVEAGIQSIKQDSGIRNQTRVNAILRSGIPGVIFRPLIAFQSLYKGNTKTVGSFLKVLGAIDRFNVLSKKTESGIEYAFDPAKPELQTKLIESPHPYTKGTIDQNLQIPGALYMTVEFDERCCSRNSNDALKISRAFPRWQYIAYGSPGQRHHSGCWPTGKYRHLLRVKGNTLTFYWNVEKDDKKHKENNWGFHCTVYGYVPNCRSLRPCVDNPIAPLLPWSVDLELSLSFCLGRICSKMVSIKKPLKLSLAELDLWAISDEREEKGEKEECLELLKAMERGDSGSGEGGYGEMAGLVWRKMSAYAGRRPQMNSIMKKTLLPAENAMLVCLLRHMGLTPKAVQLARLLKLPGVSKNSNFSSPENHRAEIQALQAALKPVWDIVHSLLSWMILHSQLSKRWHLLVDAVAANEPPPDSKEHKIGSPRPKPPILEMERIQRARANILELSDATTAQLCELLDIRIAANGRADALAKRLADSAKEQARARSLCHMQTGDEKGESKIKGEEKGKGKEEKAKEEKHREWKGMLIRQTSVPTSSGATTTTFLQEISERVERIARYLSKRKRGLVWTAGRSGSTPHVLEQFLSAGGKGRVSVEELQELVSARDAEAKFRADIYGVVADSLSSISEAAIKFILLRPLSCLYYAHNLAGASSVAITKAKHGFRHLLGEVTKILATSNVNSASQILLHRLVIRYCMLPFSVEDAQMIEEAGILNALLSVGRKAYDSQVFTSKLKEIGASSDDPQCTSAVTGSNFVQMEVFECKDCGLNNGECCCRICAAVCHKGHNVVFKRRSKAFCDCGFTPACQCMKSHHLLRSREEQVVLGRLAFLVFRSVSIRIVKWSFASASKLQTRTLTAIATAPRLLGYALGELFTCTNERIRVFKTCPPHRAEEQESMLRDLVRIGYLMLREVELRTQTTNISPSHQGARETKSDTKCLSPAKPLDLGVDTLVLSSYLHTLVDVIASGSQNMHRLCIRSLLVLLKFLAPTSLDAKLQAQGRAPALSGGAKGLVRMLLETVGGFSKQHFLTSRVPARAGTSTSTGTGTVGEEATGSSESKISFENDEKSRPTDSYRLVLWRPEGAPVNAYIQQFLELFSTQLAQLTQRSPSWRGEGEAGAAGSGSRNSVQSLKTNVAALKQRLQYSLRQSKGATLLVGPRRKCYDFGLKVANKGMQCVVEPCSPDVCALRNHDLAAHLQERNFVIGGQQAIERAAQLAEAIQTIMVDPSYASWNPVARSVIEEEFSRLPVAAKAAVGTGLSQRRQRLRREGKAKEVKRPGGGEVEWKRRIGSLCAVSGFLCDTVRVGGLVRVISGSSSSVEDRLEASMLPKLAHVGVVVSMEHGYNQMRVVFHDDSLGRPTLVHRSKLRGARRHQDVEIAMALGQSTQPMTLALIEALHHIPDPTPKHSQATDTKSSAQPFTQATYLRPLALGALKTILAAPFGGPSSLSRLLLRRVNLLRVLRDLVAKGLHLSASQTRLKMDAVRAIARLYDLTHSSSTLLGAVRNGSRMAQALGLGNSREADDNGADGRAQKEIANLPRWCWERAKGPMPTRWNREAAPNCLFSHGTCRVVHYAGGHNRRLKMNKGDDLPVTVPSDVPIPSGVIIHYFEIRILSPTSLYDPVTDRVYKDEKGASNERTDSKDGRGGIYARTHRQRVDIGLCPNGVASQCKNIHGWCERSLVFQCHSGRKARYLAKAKKLAVSEGETDDKGKLSVDDLLDVKDSVGKWEPAIVIAITETQVQVHYINWDSRYDEWIDRSSDRLSTFRKHSIGPAGQLFSESYSPSPIQVEDVVGCLWDRAAGTVSFTRNGVSLGVAFTEVRGRFFPAVTLHGPGVKVSVNFGQTPFKFHLAKHEGVQAALVAPEGELRSPTSFGDTKMDDVTPRSVALGGEILISPRYERQLHSPRTKRSGMDTDGESDSNMEDIDVEDWFESEDEEGFVDPQLSSPTETATPSGGDHRAIRFQRLSDSEDPADGGSMALTQQQNLVPGYSMDRAGWFEDSERGMNAEVEEAEAARTIAHISSMDSWLSQLEQGLGSQQLERVQQMLQQLRRLNFGSLAHAIMALPHLRSGSPSTPNVVVLSPQGRPGERVSESREHPILPDDISFWSPTSIAGRQTIVQEQLSTVEQSVTGAEPMVGLRVRISATAKKDSLSAESSRSGIFDPIKSPWLSQMDTTEGCIGVIRALDSDDSNLQELGPNLALVEVWDPERSLMSLWWYSVKHLLSRPASCQDAFLGLESIGDAKSALQSCLASLSSTYAIKIIQRLTPFLVHNHMRADHGTPQRLWNEVLRMGTRGEVTKQLLHDSLLARPLPEPVTSRLIKDILKAASKRLLRLDSVLSTPPLFPTLHIGMPLPLIPSRSEINPNLPPPEGKLAIQRDFAEMSQAEVMDDHLPALQALIAKNPFWGCQLLRRTGELLHTASRSFRFSTKLSAAVGRSCVVWSKSIQVPEASSLLVSFDAACRLPSGTLLSFYSNPTCTDLVRCFSRGHSGGGSGGEGGLCSFAVQGGALSIRCSISGQQSRKSSDSAGDINLRFLVSPISSHLPLACWIAHHSVNAYAQAQATLSSLNSTLKVGKGSVVSIDGEMKSVRAQIATLGNVLKGIHQEALGLLGLSQAPARVQIIMLRLLVRLLSLRPTGLFGDMKELHAPYNSLRRIYAQEKDSAAASLGLRAQSPSRRSGEKPICIHSQLTQSLVQLVVSLHLHVEANSIPPSSEELPGSFPSPSGRSNPPPLVFPQNTKASSSEALGQQIGEFTTLGEGVWAPSGRDGGEWLNRIYYTAINIRGLLWNTSQKSWAFPPSEGAPPGESKSSAQDWKGSGEHRVPMRLDIKTYEEIVSYLCALGEKHSVSPAVTSVDLSEEVLNDYALALGLRRILKVDKEVLLEEAKCIQRFNSLISECLSLIDLSATALASPWTLGAQLRQCRRLVFKQVKMKFVDRVLAATATSSSDCPTVRVNRIMASNTLGDSTSTDSKKSKEKSGRKPSVRERLRKRLFDVHTSIGRTIFGQTYNQLKDITPSRLRPAQPRGTAPHVALNVMFEGEQVLGQAGPYRAFFSDISRELQEPRSPEDSFPVGLFMPTPNNLHRIGEDRDRYMPHPSKRSVQHLELFEFVGRLMGIAMRTHIIMSLDLASLVWKQLTGTQLSLQDLRRVDEALVKNVLEPLIPSSPFALDSTSFERQFGPTVTISLTKSDASPLYISRRTFRGAWESVLEEGKEASDETTSSVRVGYANRGDLVSILVRSRLEETKFQVGAMKRGLCSIIPDQLLAILTWEELETRICGSRDIDIELLKRHTEYGPDVDRNAPHIRYLWKTLEGFTQDQRRKFVKFAFAQERLPNTDEGFCDPKIRMLIKSSRYGAGAKGASRNPDNTLPHADTCFFNVEIPAYSSEEIMRKRLTTVVNMDWGMSGDDIGAEQSLQSVLSSASSVPSTLPRIPSSQSRGARVHRAAAASGGGRGGRTDAGGGAVE